MIGPREQEMTLDVVEAPLTVSEETVAVALEGRKAAGDVDEEAVAFVDEGVENWGAEAFAGGIDDDDVGIVETSGRGDVGGRTGIVIEFAAGFFIMEVPKSSVNTRRVEGMFVGGVDTLGDVEKVHGNEADASVELDDARSGLNERLDPLDNFRELVEVCLAEARRSVE